MTTTVQKQVLINARALIGDRARWTRCTFACTASGHHVVLVRPVGYQVVRHGRALPRRIRSCWRPKTSDTYRQRGCEKRLPKALVWPPRHHEGLAWACRGPRRIRQSLAARIVEGRRIVTRASLMGPALSSLSRCSGLPVQHVSTIIADSLHLSRTTLPGVRSTRMISSPS